jgi:uncharacterized protein YdcH (DUF465 family)
MAQPNLGPQPNFDNLVQGVNTVMNEAMLIPNIPLVGQGNQIIQLLQQMDARFQQMDARFQQMDARFQQMDARFQQMDARFQQMDTRLVAIEVK